MSDGSTLRKTAPRGRNRERILRAALQIISKQGVDKVTHRAVAELAHVSPGTTTYHFVSREEMVREAFALYVGDFNSGLVAALTQKPISTKTDLIQFLVQMTNIDQSGADLSAIEQEMVLFAARDEGTKMQVASWSRALETWLSDPLEALGAQKPLEAARLLVAVCRGSEFEVMARQQPLSTASLQSRIETVLNALLP
ncbi:TetR family transcriptional regulator [Hyphomonas sp. FCG-A18]|jgi:DNA-binding transcriptional regulator YbjK|uniref:TetR/AcrR family transcriptional regulator n=1 Tax=Hyphomonas sp. FCG-A18 TaxID=3080019 RepID=UPI002B2AFCEF|nr:TetR family transcriptional regulator [Hyphomonas sp. FCG-A18]